MPAILPYPVKANKIPTCSECNLTALHLQSFPQLVQNKVSTCSTLQMLFLDTCAYGTGKVIKTEEQACREE